MFRGDEAGIHDDAAGFDGVVVKAFTVGRSAQLDDFDMTPRGAVGPLDLLQAEDTVGDALQLQIIAVCGAVVQEKHCCVATDEELLEGQQLTTVAHDVVGEEAKLGERIDDQAIGPFAIDDVGQLLDGTGELNFTWMEDGVLLIGRERGLFRNELRDGDECGVPAVRASGALELGAGLRERDVECFFAEGDASHDELHRDGSFAGAGIAFKKVHLAGRETAIEDFIEANDPGVEARAGLRPSRGGSFVHSV